jgi:uncharacterized protein RhaS with RHS repeats
LNTYGYVNGNPINRIDPLGLETTLITTVDYSVGSHSAVYIDTPGTSPFLYDPAGSYEPKSGEQRGSGDVFEGNNASLKDYIDYQKSTTSDVNTTKIPTTPEQEKAIKDRAEKQGGAAPPFCASAVSSAIGGICGIRPSPFPGQLERNAKNAKCP